jgi:hypothetical protein
MLCEVIKRVLLILALTIVSVGAVAAQSSSFTYQGRLTDGSTPANGNYDLRFALFDSAAGSSQIGQTQTITGVSVSGGVFAFKKAIGMSPGGVAPREPHLWKETGCSNSFGLFSYRPRIDDFVP